MTVPAAGGFTSCQPLVTLSELSVSGPSPVLRTRITAVSWTTLFGGWTGMSYSPVAGSKSIRTSGGWISMRLKTIRSANGTPSWLSRPTSPTFDGAGLHVADDADEVLRVVRAVGVVDVVLAREDERVGDDRSRRRSSAGRSGPSGGWRRCSPSCSGRPRCRPCWRRSGRWRSRPKALAPGSKLVVPMTRRVDGLRSPRCRR